MDNFNKQLKKYHKLYTEGPIWNKVKNAAGAAGRGVKNAAVSAGTRVWDTAKTNAKTHLQNWKDEAIRGGKNLLRGAGEVGLGLMGIPNLGILKYQKRGDTQKNNPVKMYHEIYNSVKMNTTATDCSKLFSRILRSSATYHTKLNNIQNQILPNSTTSTYLNLIHVIDKFLLHKHKPTLDNIFTGGILNNTIQDFEDFLENKNFKNKFDINEFLGWLKKQP
jgi:hypothetical protein